MFFWENYNGDDSGLESDNFDWNTEDELEIENFHSSSSCLTNVPNGEATTASGEASSSAGSTCSKLCDHFVGMGFPLEMVCKVIQEHGEENEDKLLEELLTYSVLKSAPNSPVKVEPNPCSSDSAASSWDDLSDTDDTSSDYEEITKSVSVSDGKLLSLVKMGYKEEESLIAIERLGPKTSLEELVDFISAAQVVKEDVLIPSEDQMHKSFQTEFSQPRNIDNAKLKKQRYYEFEVLGRKRPRIREKKILNNEDDDNDDEVLHLPNPMIGFPLLPLPPRTIKESFPLTRKWWPSWDPRTQLNCLRTSISTVKITDSIRKNMEDYDGDPPQHVQKEILYQCRCFNLVWVGRNKVAPLEPDEVETLLGFPRNHTRGGGISRTDRYKSLGNSFQVDTVAYHLSVLKKIYPNGINLLSLFSGIGGAEVALHRLGIPLKTVVSVEKSEVNRNVVRSWWEQTNQKGNLIDMNDVQDLGVECLEQMMNTYGGFDLIIGGSPCNNLAGSNRVSRNGLEGKESSLFFDYFRILDLVKNMMTNN
ncbi:unnamed protein product [Lupinus luteus]|uniref:DNA (cytosine-5-)-methyltransferase n=1 Tax=Lupinus luteus TaxID=3873 RepID=A0AAV1WVQ0_LUPLU